jgi:uncharacterized membrane protein
MSRAAPFPYTDDVATESEDREWSDPENWRGGWLGVYYAPRDPRIWVPKRRPWMGTTLNFAHRGAKLTFSVMLGIPLAVSLLVILAVLWAGSGPAR